MSEKLSRRRFLQGVAMAGGGAILAACAPAPEVEPEVIVEEVVIKETVVVEVEGTPEIQEVERIVTATPPPKEPVTIYATSNIGGSMWDVSYEMAKDTLPGVNLIIEQTAMQGGWPGYADAIVTEIAGGSTLDALMVALQGFPLLVESKVLRTLNPFLGADPAVQEDWAEDIDDVLIEALNWKGEQMLIPWSWNNMIIYYNTAIFEEKGIDPPAQDWTWDDFLETCLQVAEVTGSEDDVYAFKWNDAAFAMSPWYYTNDTHWLTDDWVDSNMLDPGVTEVLQFLSDLIHVHKVAPQPQGWDENGQFHSGHQVMRGCGRWCITGAENAEFDTYGFTYMPRVKGDLRTVVGVNGWGVTTLSEHPDEAWEVCKLLCSFEQGMEAIKQGGSCFCRRSVSFSDEFLNAGPAEADMKIFYESLPFARKTATPANFATIEAMMLRYYARLWAGEITVGEMVPAMHEDLQAEMDKLKGA